MSIRRVISLAIVAMLAPALLIACGGGGDSPAPAGADQQQGAMTGDSAHGEELFASLGCNACHSTGEDTIVGPGLAGLASRAGERVDGLSADAYIEQSIREPEAFLVDGFDNLMPPTFANMSESDLADLTAYLKSLQ